MPYARRLPVYLVLDCSASMSGEPIESVCQSIKMLVDDLKGDPQALKSVCLSVITFASVAQQISPLTEVMLFKVPKLEAGGVTALGGALRVLRECIDKEVRKTTENQKGDWLPLVFIITDDTHTDGEEFDRQTKDIKSLKVANIIAVGVGPYVEQSTLKRITDNVILTNTVSAGDLCKFFAWVSGSINILSRSLDAKSRGAIEVSLPQGFTIDP